MDWWQEQELNRHKREFERLRQKQMAAFNSDYTFTNPDYNFTTSATSVYYGAPYSYDGSFQPLVKTLPHPEPEAADGSRGWLDAELNEIMLVGRAEPVLA